MKQKKPDKLEMLCVEMKRYNKIHNTHLSYGQYTQLIREGKVISECWGSGKKSKTK